MSDMKITEPQKELVKLTSKIIDQNNKILDVNARLLDYLSKPILTFRTGENK